MSETQTKKVPAAGGTAGTNTKPEPENNVPSILEIANQYRGRGWQVIPIQSPTSGDKNTGKKPLLRDWPNARFSPEEIARTWDRRNPPNIGLLTGEASGLVVLDFDELEPFERLHDEFPEVEKTMAVRRDNETRRLHVYFSLTPGQPAPRSEDNQSAGWELKSSGRCIVVPPSVHYTGGVYDIAEGKDLLPWRPEYTEFLRSLNPKAEAAPGRPRLGHKNGELELPPAVANAILQGAPEGGRNSAAFDVACQLRDAGLTKTEAEHYARQFAGNCVPPLPEGEAVTAVESAYKTAAREAARNPHKPPPFGVFTSTTPPPEPPEPWQEPAELGALAGPPWPWDALPAPLRDMGQAIETTVNVSAELSGAAVLGAASIAARNRAAVELKPGHCPRPNLYLMIAAPPVSGKSPVLRMAAEPLIAFENEQRPAWKEAVAKYRAREKVLRAQIKGLERQAEKPAAPLDVEKRIAELERQIGPEPAETVTVCNDATSEALARRMAANNECIGILSGEARKLLAIARGRYTQGDSDIDLWLAGHAGDSCRVDRAGRPSYTLNRPTIAAVVATQVDSLQALGESPAMRESGFLSRFLYVIPQGAPGKYSTASVSEDTRQRYANCLRQLLTLPLTNDNDGNTEPQYLKMEGTAFDAWRQFHDRTREETAAAVETTPGSLAMWYGKLPETAGRIALLLSLCETADAGKPPGTVTTAHVESAICLAGCFESHAARAFAVIGEDAETVAARNAWKWCDKNRTKLAEQRQRDGLEAVEAVKPRDIARAGVSGCSDSKTAERALDRLQEFGWTQRTEWKNPQAKAPNQVFYFLHPNPQKR